MSCKRCGGPAPTKMCDCGEKGSSKDVVFRKASEITPESRTFILPGWWPTRCLCVLVGRESGGKSLLMAWLIGQITRGLIGETGPTPVLVLGTEDDWENDWVPRLLAVDADLELVHFDASYSIDTPDGPVLDLLHLAEPENKKRLAEAMKKAGIKVLMLDHLDIALPPSSRTIDYGDMGRALRPLNDWAKRNDLAILAGWHMGKGGGPTQDKVIGSVAIRASARVVWMIAENPDDGLRYVALEKGNGLDTSVNALSFAVVGTTVHAGGKEIETVVASGVSEGDHWGSGRDFVGRLIELASHPANPTDEDGTGVKADDWLTDFLAEHGEVMKRFAIAHGDAAGYSERTIENAASRIGVRSRRRGRQASWSLDTQPPQAQEVGPVADVADVVGETAGQSVGDSPNGRRPQPPQPPQRPQTSATSAERPTSWRGESHVSRDVPTADVIDLTDIDRRLKEKK